MMDQCCGMANEGCCMGGQQCYTYYENVCERTDQPRCRMTGREFCDEAVMPDCRVERQRRNMVSIEELKTKLLYHCTAAWLITVP